MTIRTSPSRLSSPKDSVRNGAVSSRLLDVPALAVVADPDRRWLDPTPAVVDADVRQVERQEDVRRVGGEDRLDLLVDRLAFLAVELAHALVEQLLKVLVHVADRVELRDRILAPDLVHPVRLDRAGPGAKVDVPVE